MIPELHERAHDGTVKEARMDVVVSRPGRRLQVRGARKATQIHALIVELRGGIASTGLSLLEQLSWEAAIAKPSNGSPTRLVRQWCRELEHVLAFEAAEEMRAVHGDS